MGKQSSKDKYKLSAVDSIERLPLSEQVYLTLKTAILTGELMPQEKLNEVKIAEQLQVSATPVREAFRKLAKDNLVAVSYTHLGAFMHSALTNALVVQSAAPHLRGTTAGFVNLFNQIGALLAPLLLGNVLVMTGSYQMSLMSIAIAPIIGACALFFIRLK